MPWSSWINIKVLWFGLLIFLTRKMMPEWMLSTLYAVIRTFLSAFSLLADFLTIIACLLVLLALGFVASNTQLVLSTIATALGRHLEVRITHPRFESNAEMGLDTAIDVPGKSGEENLCFLCHENRPIICAATCGHLLYCASCYKTSPAATPACTYCSKPIYGYIRVRS